MKPYQMLLWSLKMSGRELRSNYSKLLLFISSIIFGVAALVSITSFGDNLNLAVYDQSKSLLGSDVTLQAREPFNEELRALADSLGGEKAEEIRFGSMVLLPKTGDTRLSQIRALRGNFPFYGSIDVEPADVLNRYQADNLALVDESLQMQYNVQVGDTIRIGVRDYPIGGIVRGVPGETAAQGVIGPRVFIPLETVLGSALLQRGSQVTYLTHIMNPELNTAGDFRDQLRPVLDRNRARIETVESRRASLGRSFRNLTGFLNLVGFIALLLGGVGVASSIHVYIKQSKKSISVLRCLGTKLPSILFLYTSLSLIMGITGAGLGILLGSVLQTLIPAVVQDFIPVDVSTVLSLRAVIYGLVVGLIVTLLFVWLPLAGIRDISPLAAIRSSYEPAAGRKTNLLRLFVIVLLVSFILVFARLQTGSWIQALFFTGTIGIILALLALVAILIVYLIRKYFPNGWSYIWRQGLANLFRPNNQTRMLIMTIGFGTFLLAVLYLSQRVLLDEIRIFGTTSQANTVLFDVQSDQAGPVTDLILSEGFPLIELTPVVTMRIQSINSRSYQSIRQDTTINTSQWALQREYRATYRDTLTGSETITAGTWIGNYTNDGSPVPVSFETGIAENLNISVGDTVVFDLQGVPVETRVASLREVEWQNPSPNFFLVFPGGVLEPAPQFIVLLTRIDSREASARFQQQIVRNYPNISIIDLDMVLATADSILSKVTFVVQFMALFSVFTGIIVLIGAVITSRFQRMKESILLKTLGASKQQVTRIMAIEYALLGFLAAFTGTILSVGTAWLLAVFFFEAPFRPDLLPVLFLILVVTTLTIVIGLLSSRTFYGQPALDIIRSEEV
ncbi:MAG: ABC transporter permease [Cyclonatronaceae bacterium]